MIITATKPSYLDTNDLYEEYMVSIRELVAIKCQRPLSSCSRHARLGVTFVPLRM